MKVQTNSNAFLIVSPQRLSLETAWVVCWYCNTNMGTDGYSTEECTAHADSCPPFRKSVVTTWPSPAKTGLCLFLKAKISCTHDLSLRLSCYASGMEYITTNMAGSMVQEEGCLAPRQSGNAARTPPAQEILAVFEYCLKIQMGNLLLYTRTPDNQNLPPWIAYYVAL